ncbi:MAG: outer membrane beta-barrel protein [Niastella sp.]|nr:outer membrane beta-barrel protein [Niastella sp.]
MADKLQNLPPPGAVDESWEQMRILLDKEMPRGGGLPGRRNWWLFGIAIGILFLATWLSGGPFMDSNKTNVASQTLPPANQSNGTTTENNPSATADKGMAQSQSRGEPGTTTNPSSEKDEGMVIVIPAENNKDNKNIENSEPNADDLKSTLKNNRTADKKADKKDDNPALPATDRNTTAGNTITGRRTPNNKDRGVGTTTSRDRRKGKNDSNNTIVGGPTNDGSQQPMGGNPLTPLPTIHTVQATAVQAPFGYDDQPGPVLAPGTTIQKDYAQKSARLPQPPAKNAAGKKLLKTREAGVFALGFSLPLAFPLGDQRAMGYNQWAGHNTVSDYLPSPHLQYHLSSKTFLQTEAQFTSPQFVRSTLLYESRSPVVAGGYTTNSVYAKKLYYFNVPVSIHHSPFPGFYMGTGIQFSSMLSGVALTEEKKWTSGGNGTLIRETYTRFRNDTLSSRINGNEFRVLLDANYFFNRFTVGLRYNQALSNYISFQVSPNVPYTFDKNRALQFYLRYNLWEEKKKAAGMGKKVLALK